MTSRKRGLRFKASDLETGRTYLWRKEFLPLLYKYLELERGQTIVDVGCGTGAFTRLLAKGIKYQGKVIGIDRNTRLLSVAKKITNYQGIESKLVSYNVGKAESLPFPDNYADRVVCQMVLWIVKDRAKVIDEMIRVCKPGGLVGAIDVVLDKVAHYYPDQKRLGALWDRAHSAEVRGSAKLYGSDRQVGFKLPTLFKQRGLERIRLDGYGQVWLTSDDRIPFNFKLKNEAKYVKEHNTENEKNMRKEDRKILLAGGMSKFEIDELERINLERSKELVRNPDLLNQETSVNSGVFFIATGIKPAKYH